jgi:hypothetical protein
MRGSWVTITVVVPLVRPKSERKNRSISLSRSGSGIPGLGPHCTELEGVDVASFLVLDGRFVTAVDRRAFRIAASAAGAKTATRRALDLHGTWLSLPQHLLVLEVRSPPGPIPRA